MTTRDLSPEYQAPFSPAVQYLESALEPEIAAIEHWTEHRAEFEDKEIALLEFTDAVTTLGGPGSRSARRVVGADGPGEG